uniref:Uncharacterized protein n=1 Tax=Timema monikensis TaxID=170555 RepID=A0A7R9HLP5_9NEOP|nr:unnamed protein product [Timema monikensis]
MEDETVPINGEAFMCFENALKWMERQPNAKVYNCLLSSTCGILRHGNKPTASQTELEALGIEPGTSGSEASKSDHYTTEAVGFECKMGRTGRRRMQRLKDCKKPIKLCSQDETIHLTQWMTRQGCVLPPNMTPAIFEDTGRGVLTSKAIKRNPLDFVLIAPGEVEKAVQIKYPTGTRNYFNKRIEFIKKHQFTENLEFYATYMSFNLKAIIHVLTVNDFNMAKVLMNIFTGCYSSEDEKEIAQVGLSLLEKCISNGSHLLDPKKAKRPTVLSSPFTAETDKIGSNLTPKIPPVQIVRKCFHPGAMSISKETVPEIGKVVSNMDMLKSMMSYIWPQGLETINK